MSCSNPTVTAAFEAIDKFHLNQSHFAAFLTSKVSFDFSIATLYSQHTFFNPGPLNFSSDKDVVADAAAR